MPPLDPPGAAGTEDWPDNDLILEVAREMDKGTREVELIGANILFWAKALIVKETMIRIDTRKIMTRWSREVIKETIYRVPKVKLIKDLIVEMIGEIVAESERKSRLEIKKELE